MPAFSLSVEALQKIIAALDTDYQRYKNMGLSLDMTRGKPCAEQLDLSAPLLSLPGDAYCSMGNIDCRNYGGIDGIAEAKALFAEYLSVPVENILVGGNASLSLMHTELTIAMLRGVQGVRQPWSRLPNVKMLCPSPGYDRHFAMCEAFGIEMLPVPLLDSGPDMDMVEQMVREDALIKGIFCVPKYSNPTGITYAKESVLRLAEMETAADDFRLFWDNAYAVHDLVDDPVPLENIFDACEKAGNPDRPLIFGSTSKITFPGAGLAVFASSTKNLNSTIEFISKKSIGPDKLNQLRHVLFLQDRHGISRHMKRHRAILEPKFNAVYATLGNCLGNAGLAKWTTPDGGYFVNLDTTAGGAAEVIKMAADLGVAFTPAGATYPYSHDPRNSNIRIAPSYPAVDEIEKAIEVLSLCIKLYAYNSILSRKRATE
ncbi:MAG: aminotransferase class I/II-fold pyridoxal phosphate-dependent enzyme [Gammaproteobacteria bacterium]|nr:aminotransferase class I/II-fold pyridoxal phosphate-dependent enzyme [Gammaproteobacteria bacterium]